ncbi:hypothetical protein ACIBJE_17360 [Micromonospora sp. NPDC050187]|uniref:hypothetical protein n=1 Tax=Micromonospora sp. NPDC050187 TaxID=3364277 RepID=UPI00379B3CEB
MLILGWLPGPDSKAGPDSELVPCGEREPIKVVSSTEKHKAIQELADRYNKDETLRPRGTTCADVTVEGVSSGTAELLLANPGVEDPAITGNDRAKVKGAQVWTPSSTLWLDRLSLDTGHKVQLKSLGSLARSPMVLAMHEKLAQRWNKNTPTWGEAIELLQDQGAKYTQEDPRGSTSGSMATFLTFDAAALANGKARLNPKTINEDDVRNENIRKYVQDVQRAAESGYSSDSIEILKNWARDDAVPEDTIFIIQEQMAWYYNSGQYAPDGEAPEVPLVAVYPVTKGDRSTAESLFTDHPYVSLHESPKQQDAAEDFFSFITQENTLCKWGFRAPERMSTANCSIPEGAGPNERIDLNKKIQALDLPTVDMQKAMHEAWRSLKSPRRILIAMDVSGSMKKDRLDTAIAAVRESMEERLRADDQVEVWQFAGTKDYQDPYWPVLDMRKVGKQPKFPELKQEPHSRNTQQTAFLHTSKEAYKAMSGVRQEPDDKLAEEKTVDAVIIVSDGIDDWDDTNETVDTVCNEWSKPTLARVPVVHTIYYEPYEDEDYSESRIKAGKDAMERLATCNKKPTASSWNGNDPESMKQAFSRIMTAL